MSFARGGTLLRLTFSHAHGQVSHWNGCYEVARGESEKGRKCGEFVSGFDSEGVGSTYFRHGKGQGTRAWHMHVPLRIPRKAPVGREECRGSPGWVTVSVDSIILCMQAANLLEDTKTGEWQAHSKQARAKLGISTSYMPWSRRSPQPKLDGVPCTPRVLQAINIAWAWATAAQDRHDMGRDMAFPFYIDCSQCVSRKVWSHRIPTLTTTSCIYDYENDSVITGAQKCGLQGMPIIDLAPKLQEAGLSDIEMSDLAGEAMFLPTLGTILAAVFLSRTATWWRSADAGAADEGGGPP